MTIQDIDFVKLREFALKYFESIQEVQKTGPNLVGLKDFESFYNRLFLDSILPCIYCKEFKESILKGGPVVDVGFGGGLPLIPLAYLFPEISFLGIEAVDKKVKAVESISNQLGLNNVKVIHERIENISLDTQVTVVSKAVGPCSRFIPWITSKFEIDIFFYKGKNFQSDEGDSLLSFSKRWEIEIYEQTPDIYDDIFSECALLNLVHFRSKFPRGTTLKKKQKKKVKLVSLLSLL